MMPIHRPCRSCHAERRKTSSPSTMRARGSVPAETGAWRLAVSSRAAKAKSRRLNKIGVRRLGDDACSVRASKKFVDCRNSLLSYIFAEFVYVEVDMLAH